MLRTALRDAGVGPRSIDYIEAHGTGTAAGDPVEIETIGRVMSTEPRERPCAIGSVKTNIGHTESAAGVAGVIKVALSLEQRTVPASLHLNTLNPAIPWAQLPVSVQTAAEPWPHNGHRPLAGVSGFGITGTNAHVILEGVDPQPSAGAGQESSELFTLSAHGHESLRNLATGWRDRLRTSETWPSSLSDLAYTAARRRTHHDHRLAIAAANRVELEENLSAWLTGEEAPAVHTGNVSRPVRRRAAFVFPGQGGQWAGMGCGLLKDEPVFRAVVEACDQAIRKHTGWSVVDRLVSPGSLEDIDVVQPVLFALDDGTRRIVALLGNRT